MRIPRPSQRRDDDGMALLFVLAVMFLLTAFLLVSLQFSMQQVKPTRRDQDSKAALAAAQAGLDDYVARLTANQSYWQTTDATNPALTTSGASLPGTKQGATYRYQVIKTPNQVSSGGRLVVRATGTVNGVSRSLTASLSPGSFLSYVYLTDKENLSPLYTGSSDSRCTQRWWQGRYAAGCSEIQFAGGDTFLGPVHTNDTPMVGGSVTFASAVTTSTMTPSGASPTTPCSGTTCFRNNGGAYFPSNSPTYSVLVQIPSTNSELAANALDVGCVYYGATHFTFSGATMTVYSPNTTTANRSACFNPTNRSLSQTVSIPPAIYVKDLGAACSATTQTALKYPYGTEYISRLTPDYGCGVGTAYIKGSVNGNVTIGSAQDIIITGNLTYTNDPVANPESTDIVGLVPTHTVWVYHPVDTYGNELRSTSSAVTKVQAAILTLQDSFIVQQFNNGDPLGTLTVYGSLAQNYRGAVGTSYPTGYVKNYVYDARFASGAVQPTYFLKPTSSSWQYTAVSDG